MLKRLALVLALLVPTAWPQASTGSVSGTVRDVSEAVVPAASVTLTNVDTGVASRANANDVGFFMFPGVIPGNYKLAVEHAGMQKFEATLTVRVTQNVAIDPKLQPGQTSTVIEVADATPMVVTNAPTLSHVLEHQRIEQLPINGRQLQSLLITVPGMEGLRAFGMRDGSFEMILDGAATQDRLWGAMPRRQASLEAVQEFRVENNSSSAKFSRPTSIVVSTRSGTNTLHGTAFETNRNNGYGKARNRQDFFTKPPQLNRNEFGVSAGAPVYLPKVYNGKNRTFWFFSYEGMRRINPTTKGFPVPTEAMRNGDFSGLTDSQHRPYTIYDPWSTDAQTWARTPFPGNKIPSTRQGPISKSLFGITPMPTEPGVNPLIDNNWWGPTPLTERQWVVNTRIDHRIGDRDQIYGRYSQASQNRFTQFYGQPMLNNVAGTVQTVAPNRTLAISEVHTFSPTFFNELIVSGNRETAFNGTGDLSRRYADEMGLPNPMGVTGWPAIYETGLYNDNYYFETQNTTYTAFSNLIVDDNLTKIKGRHEFQFGGHFRYDQLNYLPDQQQVAGSHGFATGATGLYDPSTSRQDPGAVPNTGLTIANMYLGVMNYSNQMVRNYFYARAREYALYFQDNFRVNSRLTLNLGLRWEYWPSYSEKNNMMMSFDPNTKSIVLGQDLETMYRMGATTPSIVNRFTGWGAKFESWKDAGMPQKLINNYYKDFGPRLGFAYRLGSGSRSFVLRGGYRMSYFPIPLSVWGQRMRQNAPTNARFYNDMYTNGATSPDGVSNYGLRAAPPIIGGLNSKNAVSLTDPRSLSRGSAMASYFDVNQPDSRVQDWNLTLEKEVGADTVVRIAYIGNHVSNLDEFYRYNEAPTDYVWYMNTGKAIPGGEFSGVARRGFDQQVYGTIERYQKTGWSNDNGVQFEVERRFSKGYGYQFFYNMQNALTAGGKGSGGGGIIPGLNQFLPGTVPTDPDQLNRLFNYQRDTTIPKHRVRWNWIADLPFGKGKVLAGNLPAVLDKIVGGWQVTGAGSLRSNYVSLPGNMFATGTPAEIYGYQYPIQDCRTGTCRTGYLFANGYINPNQINSTDANGKPNGVMGVPQGYKPAVQPLNPWPVNPSRSDPMYSYYGGNTTWVKMADGSSQRTTFDNGLMPLRNQYIAGPRQWGLDATLVKNIPFREHYNVRFVADFFNVFNHPGNVNTVGNDGLLYTTTSGQESREIQLSLRFSW